MTEKQQAMRMPRGQKKHLAEVQANNPGLPWVAVAAVHAEMWVDITLTEPARGYTVRAAELLALAWLEA